ncbi:gliding motility protein GldN [Fulvivirgaceae bacterium BMA10]|uniref:Gliding motility protein GldN n=1 Tax=Splendidivirga corallicola TaxID=3051826 RepID=A0ABT8KTF6_9BACT|nr:gliding motility protein GldN [Fulvivirgaceae bacterium BMA10]
MKKIRCAIGLVLFSMIFSTLSVAQEKELSVNPNSVYPILNHDIMFKKRVWRRMDLKEKKNRPFFAFNNEITKIVIEAVQSGILHPYMNDSLKTRMSKEEFLERLKVPDLGGELTDEEKALGFGEDEEDDWGDDDWGDEGADASASSDEGGSDYFFPQDVSVLEISEDVIFDKKRSRLYYDIQSITLILPAENFASTTGLRKEVGTFKYIDLVALFRSMPQEAIWFNPQNSHEHKNLADAFTLRLFDARITKIANPENLEIVDIYSKSPKEAIMASQRLEHQLMEMEHNLWDF